MAIKKVEVVISNRNEHRGHKSLDVLIRGGHGIYVRVFSI